ARVAPRQPPGPRPGRRAPGPPPPPNKAPPRRSRPARSTRQDQNPPRACPGEPVMTSDTASQIACLARVLKAPALRESAERLAVTARDDGVARKEGPAARRPTSAHTLVTQQTLQRRRQE